MEKKEVSLEECMSCSTSPKSKSLQRRLLGKLAFGAGFLGMNSAWSASGLSVAENRVNIETKDGLCDAYFICPDQGKYPGVLMWTDIRGLRPSFIAMGRRLASEGYSVLIPNPFYRASAAPIPAPDFDYSNPEQRAQARKLVAQLFFGNNAEKDTKVFLEFLQGQIEVDNTKKMGASGYCMGGPLVIRSAASFPDAIGAAASFHGGGLVTEKDNSPHLLIPQIKANVLIAIASNDDEREPETKKVLKGMFQREEVNADIEVYEEALHGWCVTDSSVYNQVKAEVAWKNLLQLYKKSLI